MNQQRLPQVLLDYLIKDRRWPGGDGLTLEDALSCYSNAAVAGEVPNLLQLRESYPDLAGELDAFFAGPQELNAH